MDDREYFSRLFETLEPKLRFPNDKRALNAWQVYEPSFFTQILNSEQNRQLYAEAFDFVTNNEHSKKNVIKEDKSDAQAENIEPPDIEPSVTFKTAPTLKEIVLRYMLDTYKGGPFDENVQLSDKVWIGEHLNVDLPVDDVVELDNPVFWRRVADAKCTDKSKLEECHRNEEFDWKRLGIECKLKDIFEHTSRESWDEEKMEKLAKAVNPYVYHLNIEQLLGVSPALVEKNQFNPLYKMFNYPPKDCHHGNLGAALAHLENLQSLTLRFGVKNLQYKYQLRLFEMSYQDIENLASGLSKLVNLRTLVITNSRLDDRKCKILVRGLVSCHLEKLELSCCHLEDPAGKAIGFYLINCPNTLKLLELRDNYISGSGLQGIGYGIQLYSGELDYIGLAGNPIGENGLVALGSGFCLIEQIKRIDISRCDIKGEGPFRLVQMIGFHERLEWLNISAVHIGDQIGEILVSAVKYHWNLLYLDVRGCGLTENQQRKIKMILARNTFYKANPCMRKEYFEVEDAIEIDEWIAKPKHPILLRVFERQPSPDRCDEYEPRKHISGHHIPAFIPASQRKVVSTSEILDINYIDCFGPDTEENNNWTPNVFGEDMNDGSLINIQPNQFTQDYFNTSVVIGNLVDLSSKQYYK